MTILWANVSLSQTLITGFVRVNSTPIFQHFFVRGFSLSFLVDFGNYIIIICRLLLIIFLRAFLCLIVYDFLQLEINTHTVAELRIQFRLTGSGSDPPAKKKLSQKSGSNPPAKKGRLPHVLYGFFIWIPLFRVDPDTTPYTGESLSGPEFFQHLDLDPELCKVVNHRNKNWYFSNRISHVEN